MSCTLMRRSSLKQRERMVMRVVSSEGWPIAKAAEAAESERPDVLEVGRALPRAGRAGLLDRSSAPQVVANRTDAATEQLFAALRRLRFTAPELAELLGMPLLDDLGGPKRLGMGKLGRLGLEPAVRYERERPGELIHIDVKKLGRIKGGAGKRITGRHGATAPGVTDAAGVASQHDGLGCRSHRDRRRHPPGLRRGPRRRESDDRDRFLRRAIAFFARHGITVERVLTDNGAPYAPPPTPSPAAPWASATSAPAPTAPDQRQSRTLHPHHARRLGLQRRRLRLQPRTRRRP